MKRYLVVANWKMYFDFKTAVEWYDSFGSSLRQSCTESGNSLVICPSFDVLCLLHQKFTRSPIALGAQDCSDYARGAYTGQVTAESLAQLGCSYCIVGHSERRNYQHETDDVIAKKITLLAQNGISPILCIGESKQAYEGGITKSVLEQQLQALACALATNNPEQPLFIAYEPVWSIGTGVVPENSYLENVFCFIRKKIENLLPKHVSHGLLYGGSVNLESIVEIKKVSAIDGFLIGKASTDFQQLKKMIELL